MLSASSAPNGAPAKDSRLPVPGATLADSHGRRQPEGTCHRLGYLARRHGRRQGVGARCRPAWSGDRWRTEDASKGVASRMEAGLLRFWPWCAGVPTGEAHGASSTRGWSEIDSFLPSFLPSSFFLPSFLPSIPFRRQQQQSDQRPAIQRDVAASADRHPSRLLARREARIFVVEFAQPLSK